MVYTERTEKCISPKDNKNHTSTNKAAVSTHKDVQQSSASSSSSTSWSKQTSNDDKWKFNHMVKDNRDKFNNLHFC